MTGNPFWRFSMSVYGDRAVQDCCLYCQDKHGVDINLLLFCCWLDQQQRPLQPALLQRARRAVAAWNTGTVRPLRDIRRRVKTVAAPGSNAFYQALLSLELQAERVEQNILFACFQGWRDEAANSTGSYLSLYLAQFDRLDESELQPLLARQRISPG